MAVTENTRLADLANNPVFGGWGRALLPWHGQREDGATIGGESSLLPYHSNVQPAQAVSALNRLLRHGGLRRRRLAAPGRGHHGLHGQSDYTAGDPATYAVVGDRDGIAPSSIMEQRIRGFQRAGVPADIAIFPGLSHGFGTGEGTAAQGWMQGALDFWLAQR